MSKFRVICFSLSLAALPTSAFAADLAPAPVEPVAPVAMPWSWTGFYVGANAGYGFAGKDRVGVWPGGVLIGDIGSIGGKGFLGGGQVGYNYQISNFVLGVEADFQGAQIKDSLNGTLFDIPGHATSRVNWFGTVRPRVGYAFDRTLVYATGGLAYGNVDYKLTYDGLSLSESKTRVGWTAGAGIEQALTDNISVKLEYDYVGLPRYTARSSDNLLSTKPTASFHMVRVGLNYKF